MASPPKLRDEAGVIGSYFAPAGAPPASGWAHPLDFWLEDWEKQAIIGFYLKNALESYAE